MKAHSHRAGVPESSGPRRPYASPEIEETSEFETLALTCGVAVGECGDFLGDPPTPPLEGFDQS